jgi:hypothetical protein
VRSSKLLPSVVLLLAGLAGCSSEPAGPTGADGRPQAGLAGAQTPPFKLVAVGDIACPPGATPTAITCRQADTAELTGSIDPDRVLALGDLQYNDATYYQFTHSYDLSWGSLKPITKPLLGNHEYHTADARGYYRYWGGQEPGYYAWNAGTWRIYNLNSNCSEISCRRELTWLENDLTDHPRRCSIIAGHHPRFSSGFEHGSTPGMKPFWQVAYRHHVDIALAGHDHDYERFARKDPSGNLEPNRGIQSFVSGAGGQSLYHLGTRRLGSLYFHGRHPGVLTLLLGDGKWTWRYRTVDGILRDSGSRSCL